jgi:hypothetical protein
MSALDLALAVTRAAVTRCVRVSEAYGGVPAALGALVPLGLTQQTWWRRWIGPSGGPRLNTAFRMRLTPHIDGCTLKIAPFPVLLGARRDEEESVATGDRLNSRTSTRSDLTFAGTSRPLIAFYGQVPLQFPIDRVRAPGRTYCV